ncbi:MAG TPA: glycosyltransferase [Syntrophales bacterium]|nr:glycosyltransferase [Syntrophales bacterium]
MKIAYITAKIPFGSQETFILTEMLVLKRLAVDILIIPRDKSKRIFHKEAESLLDDTLSIPWFDVKIFITLLKYIVSNTTQFVMLLINIFFRARNVKVGFKNMIILPKALYISKLLKKKSVSHIHAHWASTTSTMAYIISKVTGIPWSFTAHRWDIAEDNILHEKCLTASFIRAINENGRNELSGIIRDMTLEKKIQVIHMGTLLPTLEGNHRSPSNEFTVICPANFVHVKGHKYLFKACHILVKRGVSFRCLVAGDGPLENELKRFVNDLNLNSHIKFLGRLPHDTLLDLYHKGSVHAVVLPSVTTENNEKEGIPVALIEAMAFGIPVISTKTGGIPELIAHEGGIMVEEKNSTSIANAIEKLSNDGRYYSCVGKEGRKKVERDFNIVSITETLAYLFSQNGLK